MKRIDAPRELEMQFAALLYQGLSATDAYLQTVGKTTKHSNMAVTHTAASRYASRPDIRAEIERLKAKTMAHFQKKAIYTAEQAMIEADNAIALATAKGQANAMVAAITLKAKLNGLLVEDRRNDRTPLSDMTDDQLEQVIKAVTAEVAGLLPKPATHPATPTVQ